MTEWNDDLINGITENYSKNMSAHWPVNEKLAVQYEHIAAYYKQTGTDHLCQQKLDSYSWQIKSIIHTYREKQIMLIQQQIDRIKKLLNKNMNLEYAKTKLKSLAANVGKSCRMYSGVFQDIINAYTFRQHELEHKLPMGNVTTLLLKKQRIHFVNFSFHESIVLVNASGAMRNCKTLLDKHTEVWKQLIIIFDDTMAHLNIIIEKAKQNAVQRIERKIFNHEFSLEESNAALAKLEATIHPLTLIQVSLDFNDYKNKSVAEFKEFESVIATDWNWSIMLDAEVAYAHYGIRANLAADHLFEIMNEI